jgi:nicotinate-nucleotide pyrophosphorylase (carboxylating)
MLKRGEKVRGLACLAQKRYLPFMNDFTLNSLIPKISQWLSEDDLERNFYYLKALPSENVKPYLKIKSDLILSGVDYFTAVFVALGADASEFEFLKNWDGRHFSSGEVIEFPGPIPSNIALTGERLALNLLQHSSSITTWTKKHVDKASVLGIKILDTRKTTPGLRELEKYATRVGGAYNHRFGQTDSWMIKDNHKAIFGSLVEAVDFFKNLGVHYNNMICEIHDLSELHQAIFLGLTNVMLDNFSVEELQEAIKMKKSGMIYEVSGGPKLSNLDSYLIKGIDAISLGSIIYDAPHVDISLKFKKI